MLTGIIRTRVRTCTIVVCSVLALVGLAACRTDASQDDGEPRKAETEGCAEETVARLAPVVQWHTERYPELEVEDLYKLLHQAVAGPAHAIEDPEMARQWMEREWNSLDESLDAEEMFEPLSSDGRLVRVNLRPWRAAGRAPEPVLHAFVRTANALPPDTARIRTDLDAVSACSDRIADGLRLSSSSIQAFLAERAREGYPAVHHSETYTAAYRPAYRVVIRSYLD